MDDGQLRAYINDSNEIYIEVGDPADDYYYRGSITLSVGDANELSQNLADMADEISANE